MVAAAKGHATKTYLGIMTDTDTIIIDTTARIFRELADPQTLATSNRDDWQGPLWTALEESGLTRAWVPDDLGGAGAEITDGFDILVTAGRFAVAVPLAETLLAGWLLARAGIPVPDGPLSVAVGGQEAPITVGADGILSGSARAVPFAGAVGHLALLAEQDGAMAVALVDASSCTIEVGTNLAGEPLGNVSFDGVTPITVSAAPDGLSPGDVMLMGAAIRAQQMAGGLQGVLDLAVDYAKERVAFGRPIAKFQAVQHNLARLAGEVAAAVAAAGSAADSIQTTEDFNEAVFLEIAAAKIRTGEAVGTGAGIAHQVFGAIGFTAEHVLQRYTKRLWAWRDDFGSESEWAVGLGAMVAANGADELWPLVASR